MLLITGEVLYLQPIFIHKYYCYKKIKLWKQLTMG